MAINIQGGTEDPKKVLLEFKGRQAEVTEDGAIKVDSTHTIQTVEGTVDIGSPIDINQPIETKELNTVRSIESMPPVKIDPGQNTVKAEIDQPITVSQNDTVLSRIVNSSINVEGEVAVSNIPVPLNDAGDSVNVDGSVSIENLPQVQEVDGTVTIKQAAGDRLKVDANIGNIPLPVSTGENSLNIDGEVGIKPGDNLIGSVNINGRPEVSLPDIAKDTAGHLQVDVLSQPTLTFDEVKINPEWNDVTVTNWPDVQTVNLAENTVRLPTKIQENLKSVSAEVTNTVTVNDISDNKHVVVNNWPAVQDIRGEVTLPSDTVDDLKVVQVDNFPAVQPVSLPNVDVDSLGRFTVKVDKLPNMIQIDDSTPIKVDTELTVENAQINLDNLKSVDVIDTLTSITNPVPIDDTEPIKVDVIGIDQVTFTNSYLDTHEQNAYDDTNDRFKVTVEEDLTGLRDVNVVNQELPVHVNNIPAVQEVSATDLDIRTLTATHDHVSAQILNDSLTVNDGGQALTVDGMVDINNFPNVYPITNDGAPLSIEGTVDSKIVSSITLDVAPDLTKDSFPVVGTDFDIRQLTTEDIVSIEGGNVTPVNIEGNVTVDNLPENQDVTVTNISLDTENHVQADLLSLPAVELHADTLAALENTTVTVDNIPENQDVTVTNINLDELGNQQVDIVDMPSVPQGDNIIGRTKTLGSNYDELSPSQNEIRVNASGEQFAHIVNLPEVQKVDLNNVSQDTEQRLNVNIDNQPTVKIDDTTPIRVDTELTVENAEITLDNLKSVDTIDTLTSITNPVPIDDTDPIRVDVIGIDTVNIEGGILDTREQNAYDATNDRFKVSIENEPAVRDVNVTNTVLPVDGTVEVTNIPTVQTVEATNLDIRALTAATDSITATIDNSSIDVNLTNGILQDASGHGQVDVLSLPEISGNVIVDNLPVNQDVTITNTEARDADGHSQVDIVNTPTVNVENLDLITSETDHSTSSVQIYGNDGVSNQPVATDDEGRLRTVREQNKGTIDKFFEAELDKHEWTYRDFIIPDGEEWVLETLGYSFVPEHRDWHNMHKDYGIEIEMIWDPDGVDETFRRLSGNSYVPEVNLRKSFVGDGNKKIRVIIRNRSHDDDDLIVSSWFLGYTQ